ncbi:ATP-binding protein [bacterium]|nr:ATP-binding protein [bacterium]
MKILDYGYHGPDWEIQKIRFQQINLIVGDSGTGKTKLLNTLFNLGTFVARSQIGGKGEDHWDLSIEIEDDIYEWRISTVEIDDKIVVEKETLLLNEKLMLERHADKFLFRDKIMPKLPNTETSLSLLKEEEGIKPLYDGFARMLRRRFFSDDLERNSSVHPVNQRYLDRIGKRKDFHELYKADLPLNPRLHLLSTYFHTVFKEIVRYYKEIFDFIDDVKIRDSGSLESLRIPSGAPVFCIKEKSVDKWLGLDELSSGMQKVLLILTDLLSLPEGCVYLIDEYENSLGTGAIEFLPNLIFSKDIAMQLIITSHHPYIIKEIPTEYWYVAHRKGSKVQFDYGDELVNRYSHSNQEKYIQLLNDPVYSEGIE